MRERRWESRASLDFGQLLAVAERLAGMGLKPATPDKEVIVYVEEWSVASAGDLDRLDRWNMEDVTLVHCHDDWRGDYYLLASAYHTRYQQLKGAGTYCSVCHPWHMTGRLITHLPAGMCWVGFRESHAFLRVRLHTAEVVTPGETREDERHGLWVEERTRAFLEAIAVLELPIEPAEEKGHVVLRSTDPSAALLCSWPDAFGPCQFEFNASDPVDFLVRAGKLAATTGGRPATVRAYLTGFSPPALEQFRGINPNVQQSYRCSVHCRLQELPELLGLIAPEGRLYSTLCEFQTSQLLPGGESAWAIIGAVGGAGGSGVEPGGGFRVEARLNRAPLAEEEMAGWLEQLLDMPMVYAPLPPFQ